MEPKKLRNSFGMHSGSARTVAACCSTRPRHWRRVGSSAATDEDNKTDGLGTSSFSMSSDCASKVSLSLLFYICIYCFYLGFL